MMIVITIVFLNTALVNAEYKDVNYTTDTTIPGLEYLGCGYNAAGSVDCKESDNCGIDLNFKNPVLRFEWENGIQNLNNTLEWVHPKNTYIWNYPNCFFAEHTSQKSSASSLSKLVDSNLSVDLINLNGNVTSEKNSLDKAQSQRRLKEAYCSVFVAGTFLNEYR
ncbi:signal peptide-containing protein [Theileria equi strain WA]|uniref:Signal peptide-containing protein n=1 Tax=Theileria equi strain WA TaxID=1537102 RepID=L0AVP0_THEEQ|nr:signal peptide-containing protein [Theileria equi strain WA]AFZ79615.1 signal peptide-containing protein [Theileria equi strain WA]|eukprot:XP_004829281.1 signal peptide-containing protein [Theileria equi strain WA]